MHASPSRLFRRRDVPLGVHSGVVPLDLFAGTASALLGGNLKHVRLQQVLRGGSFLTFSCIGLRIGISSAMPFLLLLPFLLSVMLFGGSFLSVCFSGRVSPATVFGLGLGIKLVINLERVELCS